VGQELLLFLVSSLHFTSLLFKYLSIILRNIGRDDRRHGDIEEKTKTSLFCLYIVDLGTIMELFG